MAESDQHPNDEELLSAYCDGELRGAELARAEELLANRPECRQLLEEYRTLRSRLQDVPPRTLSGDFAERVLRRAERDMLVTAAPAEPLAHAASRWPQGRRPWVYAVMAVAAALIIMLVESNQQAPEQMVLNRHEPLPGQAGISAAPSADQARIETYGKAAAASRPAVDRAAKSAAPADASVQMPGGRPPASSPPGAVVSKDSLEQALTDDMDVKRVLDDLGWPAIAEHAARQAATLEQQQGGPVLPSDVLVVECSIAPQNRSPDPMVASFASNSIAFDDRLAKPQELPAKADGQPARADAAAASSEANGPEAVEMFFVVATPDQLEATLADLSNRPGVSWKRLTDNRLNRAGIADQAHRAGEGQRSTVDAKKEKTLPTAGNMNAERGLAGESRGGASLNVGQSQYAPANVASQSASQQNASQQGRAQRLSIPENLRRLVEAAPSLAGSSESATGRKRRAEKTQPPLPGAVASNPGLSEPLKSSAPVASPPPAAEQAPLQRALFIVRIRPPEK